MKILGLDISTSCTGWCLLSENGSLIDMGSIPLSRERDFFKKADLVRSSLELLKKQHKIERIVIEENLQAYRPGLASAKTLMCLARFNGIVSYICRDMFKCEPEYYNVNVARRTVGLKVSKNSPLSTKEQVLSWVEDKVNGTGHVWPTKKLKSGPRKGKTIKDPSCFDMADAYVVCLASCL